MYNAFDYPYMGEIVKIEITDMDGFINNVFGADKLLELTEKQRANNNLLGCMLETEFWSADGKDDYESTVIYLLNEDNLAIHDTAFLSDDELEYISAVQVERPECINDFAKNIDIRTLNRISNFKVRRNNGKIYRAKVINGIINVNDDTGSIMYSLNNKQHVNRFIKLYDGFIDSHAIVKPVKRIGRNYNRADHENIDKFVKAVKILAEAGDERLRKMAADSQAEERRQKLRVLE